MSEILTKRNTLYGIGFMLTAFALLNATNVIIKLEASTHTIGQIVFLRNAFGLLPAIVMVLAQGGLKAFKFQNIGLHLKRGILGSVGVFLILLSLKLLILTAAATIYFTASLFITALAWPILKESVGIHRWSAVILGFAAILLANLPLDLIKVGTIIALLGAFFDATNHIYSRLLSREEKTGIIHFNYTLIGTITTLPLILINPDCSLFSDMPLSADIFGWPEASWEFLSFMALVGIGGSLGQLCITLANHFASPPVIAPMIYSSLLWGIFYDVTVWGKYPPLKLLLAATAVIACGLYIIYRERKTLPTKGAPMTKTILK